ncbi:unnamed protein product [Phyllotreta striolata]|uniref:Uncharacterized protein n=1 Tax=Phyllotreta striolata TaxID=444603 RepID=A0A9N9TR70_PHYSR|nr:unnamed protein product [Phyllotreta striolata]
MFLPLFILVCLYTVVYAASPNYFPEYRGQQNNFAPGKNVVPILSESNESNPDGSFSYSYSTGDGQQVQAQGYLKNTGVKGSEAEVIQGSYSYTAPDGTPITVTYIADEFGFRAEGAHLPTPPPIPEAIQKSLELIAQAQGRSSGDRPIYPQQRPYRSNYRSQYRRAFAYDQ